MDRIEASLDTSRGPGFDRLDEPAFRRRCYAAIALGFVCLAIASAACKSQFDFLVGDAPFYYAYIPYHLVDSQSPQAHAAFNRIHSRDKYPLGFALTVLPAFAVGHALAVSLSAATGLSMFAPDGYTVTYQLANLLLVMGLGLATFLRLDRLLTERARLSGKATALAIGVFWIGSHYSYYYFREPLMIHVLSAFWVVANIAAVTEVVTAVRQQKLSAGPVFLWVLTGAMAVVCRPSNAFLVTFGISLLVEIARARQLGRLALVAPVGLLGLSPLLLQLLYWHWVAGTAVHYSYGDESFRYWNDPKLWQTLISSRHGLFFWSPVLLGSVIGIGWHLRRHGLRDPLLLCLLTGFVLLWYANSSWYGWWFGDAFGARAFLEMAPLFVLGLAYLFEELLRASRSYWFAAGIFIGVGILYNYGLMFLYITRLISRSRPLLG